MSPKITGVSKLSLYVDTASSTNSLATRVLPPANLIPIVDPPPPEKGNVSK